MSYLEIKYELVASDSTWYESAQWMYVSVEDIFHLNVFLRYPHQLNHQNKMYRRHHAKDDSPSYLEHQNIPIRFLFLSLLLQQILSLKKFQHVHMEQGSSQFWIRWGIK